MLPTKLITTVVVGALIGVAEALVDAFGKKK